MDPAHTSQCKTSSTSIPIVDFSRWRDSQITTERLAVARDLISACQSVGFVYISNHGLPQTLINQAFATSKQLFDLPLAEKLKAPHPPGPDIHRGYSQPGLEKVSQYSGGDEAVGEKLRQIVDVKESYEVGAESNTLQPNIWLPEDVLPGFKQFTTRFYWACNELAQELLKCLALGLGLSDQEFFVKACSGENNQLRLLHYPPVLAEDLEKGCVARISSHSDWGIITLLFQDDCGGLEVEDPTRPGVLIPATPVLGTCVMNVGDLLMRWTNDLLKSTMHRVGLPAPGKGEGQHRMTRARYSIPYFVSADPETSISCLLECVRDDRPPKYEPVKQSEYARMRAKVQYRTGSVAE